MCVTMKLCTCFLLFNIFVVTNCITRIIKPNKELKFIRVPVETVAGNSSDDFGAIGENVDSGHSFIATVTDGKDNLQLVFTAPKAETFTDFIQETVDILNTYEAATFKDFFQILDIEIRNYHYEGCRFSELMQNYNTRSLLAAALTSIRDNSVTFTKANINEIADMLRDEMYEENVKELLNYINSLYNNYEPEFRRVLNNLNNYTETKSIDTHNDLVETVRDGVRTIFFNHYAELDTNTRRELKEKIETFWEINKKISAPNDIMNSFVNRTPVIHSVVKKTHAFKTIEDKIKENELAYNNDPKKFLRNIKKILSKDIDESDNKYESSIESETLASDYSAKEFPSGQSLDSSNSIKHSQERFKMYNTQRYMTLYTEEVSYKSRTTRKTQILPISEITRKSKFHRRSTTPRYRPRHKKKIVKNLRANYDMDDTKQDFSESRYDSDNGGLMLESENRPIAIVQSDRQRKSIKGAPQSNSVSTETMITHPKLRTEHQRKQLKLNADSIEPEYNNTFNDYVQNKILSLQNELKVLKQMNYLRTTNNGADKADVKVLRNGVDDQGNAMEINHLLKNYYHSHNGQIHIGNKNSKKPKSPAHTHKPSKPKVVKTTKQKQNDTVTINTTEVVNETKPSVILDTFHIDTEDLSNEFSRNNMTTTTTTSPVESSEESEQHKEPDNVNLMLQARTKM